MVTTEFAIFNLNDNLTPSNIATSDIWNNAKKTLRAQPGLQKFYQGFVKGDEKKIYMIIEWESLAHHRAFEALDTYGAFVQSFYPIMNLSHPEGPIALNHFDFPKNISSIINSSESTISIFKFNKKADITTEQLSAPLSKLKVDGEWDGVYTQSLEDEHAIAAVYLGESLDYEKAKDGISEYLAEGNVPSLQVLELSE